jgi:HK97 family phage prohead protease
MDSLKMKSIASGLEHKFIGLGEISKVENGIEISGYASVFGVQDQGGDVVLKGAYENSLAVLKASGRSVKMLWQHDPVRPIGVWDEVREDARGLYVKGRLLTDIEQGREAAALIEAGAIDGLSIGYRTVRASQPSGATTSTATRLLSELELWEVSLVTFPMLPDARIGADVKGSDPMASEAAMRDLAGAFSAARALLAQ